MTIDEFFGSLSETSFDSQFLELARTEAFSAIASGVGTREDIEKVRTSLTATDIPTKFCQDDESVYVIVGWIAGRIVKKKNKKNT